MNLYVPAIPDDCDPIRGAIAWAEAGWYIGPLDPAGKHAGSVLGKGWPAKTSRDPQVIAGWFAGTDYQPFVHCGRSGAIAFDLDNPTETTDPLRRAILEERPPIHTTRPVHGDPVAAFERFEARGHALFAQPAGRSIGNGNGKLGKAWGDVRGRNGIVVVDPARHSKPEGLYRVQRPGVVPVLPAYVADLLTDSTSTEAAATDAEVKEAREKWVGDDHPDALDLVLRRWDTDVRADGASRHITLVTLACWASREALVGLYPFTAAEDALNERWTADSAVALGSGRVLTPREARSEFDGAMAWAVAQAKDPEAAGRLAEIRAKHDATVLRWTPAVATTATGRWGSLWN